MGKYNDLFKAKLIDSFYTIHGKIKVKTADNKTMQILHITDLAILVGKGMVDGLKYTAGK